MSANPARRLYDGADARAYTLPAHLLRLRAATEAADRALAAIETPDLVAVRVRMIEETEAALRDGAELPDVGVVLDADREGQLATLRREALEEAGRRLAARLRAEVTDAAEAVITDHLQPAYAQMLAEAARLVEVFRQHGTTTEALFTAPAAARSAYLKLDSEVVRRYSAIQGARDALRQLGVTAQRDERGMFGLVKNAVQVWPALANPVGGPSMDAAPWRAPKGLRELLVWAVENGAELWLPTPAEQDAAWADVFGERVVAAGARNAALRAWAGAA